MNYVFSVNISLWGIVFNFQFPPGCRGTTTHSDLKEQLGSEFHIFAEVSLMKMSEK